MSALGHKRTSRQLQSTSALPLKADIGLDVAHVSLVPIADSSTASKVLLHLRGFIGAAYQGFRA
jgi:hypothetical protein